MQIIQLKNLNESEAALLKLAPALITVLIGGADDNLEAAEEKRAERAVQFRQHTGDPLLFEYFQWVETTFEADLKAVESQYLPLTAEERNAQITAELSKVNEILTGIDAKYAAALIANFRSLAKAIADTSGGILGAISAAPEENALIHLAMFDN